MERRPVFTMPSPKITDDPGAPFRTVSTQTGTDMFIQVVQGLQRGRRSRRQVADVGGNPPESANISPAPGRRRSMISNTIRIPQEIDYGEFVTVYLISDYQLFKIILNFQNIPNYKIHSLNYSSQFLSLGPDLYGSRCSKRTSNKSSMLYKKVCNYRACRCQANQEPC